MSRKKREIPVPDPENDKEYICPSASWGDITGIIPLAAGDSTQSGPYEEVYPYPSGYEEKGRK
ncbi:MAG: hypothetical protein IKH96_14250 [Ruminococcus sp.]|uniref:hypothetical protein n=1 Tax=Ruminococcus sp. TaxID=41978 RepID=UPI0025FE2FAB|nr:hypothetical protein [Ruminococcus sp.]MBR6997156.1 hypothetical protein [Ruminococcus sp.]